MQKTEAPSASGGGVARAAPWRRPRALTPGARDAPAAAGPQSAARRYAGRGAPGAHGPLPPHYQSVHALPGLTRPEPPSGTKVLSPVNGTKRPARRFVPSALGLRVSTAAPLTRGAALGAGAAGRGGPHPAQGFSPRSRATGALTCPRAAPSAGRAAARAGVSPGRVLGRRGSWVWKDGGGPPSNGAIVGGGRPPRFTPSLSLRRRVKPRGPGCGACRRTRPS